VAAGQQEIDGILTKPERFLAEVCHGCNPSLAVLAFDRDHTAIDDVVIIHA